MSPEVRFAAMMPATRAAASASPFFNAPALSARRAAGAIRTIASAVAVRAVLGFALVSTIFNEPSARTWVSLAFPGRAAALRAVPDTDHHQHEETKRPAVDGERRQLVVAHVLHEEPDRDEAAD